MKRLFLLATLVVCSSAFAQDATFRGNPQHAGVYTSPAVAQFSKVKWQFKTGGQVLSSPAVADGILYIGSSDHFLYGLDAATGAVKWKFETGGRVQSSPAVSAGVVYFGSYDSNFYALDAATGKLKWKFKTAGERRFSAPHIHGGEPAAEIMPDPFDSYLSSPAVSNGLVFFGSGDTNIYALDTSSGDLKWKFKTGDVVHASPAISDGTLFVGSWDSYFYALDTSTGKEKWRFKTGEDPKIHNQVGIQSSAAVANGIVYFGCRDSNFYAIDVNTGKQLWSLHNKGSWVISSPAILDGKVYFATADTGLLHVVDAKSGAPVFSLDDNHWVMFSSPAIASGFLYIGSNDGRVHAADLKSQKWAWTFETDGRKKNGANYTKADGTPNYAAAFFDFFYDDMVVGVQKMASVGAVLSSPVIVNGTIYFGSDDGNVYALE